MATNLKLSVLPLHLVRDFLVGWNGACGVEWGGVGEDREGNEKR